MALLEKLSTHVVILKPLPMVYHFTQTPPLSVCKVLPNCISDRESSGYHIPDPNPGLSSSSYDRLQKMKKGSLSLVFMGKTQVVVQMLGTIEDTF